MMHGLCLSIVRLDVCHLKTVFGLNNGVTHRAAPVPWLFPAVCKSCLRIFFGILVVPLRKHWESTSVIGCSDFVVNYDWLQLQLHSKMAEVLTKSVTQVVFLSPRNMKEALCIILLVTYHP